MTPPPGDLLQLLDWRRRIFELYGEVRTARDARASWDHWRAVRDDLFTHHHQSPVPTDARGGFTGLRYFDYDRAARVLAQISPAAPETIDIGGSAGESFRASRFAVASFQLGGARQELPLYWLEEYGGGLFLPVRDATAGVETYGAGRYLLDTVKGSDLGTRDGKLVLDFNFAYNPSCAYDPVWACPLAPPASRLSLAVRAGEQTPQPGEGTP